MRRSSGFSLMEMMIVLLIVAIVAAASAPMVSRKLASESGLASTAHCLWQQRGNDITFNADMAGVPASEQNKKSVIIGSGGVTGKNGNDTTKPRLFIKTNNIKNSHIELEGEDSESIVKTLKVLFFNGNTWLSTKQIDKNAKDSVAIGNEADANKEGSVAIGSNAKANAYAVAIGSCDYHVSNPTKAGQSSVAIGHSVGAFANSVAIGYGAGADLEGGVAVGFNANAIGTDGIAIGNGAITEHAAQGGIAIGSGANSSVANAIVIGGSASSGNATGGIAIGIGAHSGGAGTIAIGLGAVGSNVSSNSVLLGTKLASGANSTIQIGRDSTVAANANNSIAIGKDITIGDGSEDSIVIGRGSSIAEGTSGTIVIGTSSNASANTTPSSSVAIGYNADVVHDNSVALGFGATGGEMNSTAIGYSTNAGHKNSTAIGYNATTTASNQIVLGNPDTTVYIPGNLVVDGSIVVNDVVVKNRFAANWAFVHNRLTVWEKGMILFRDWNSVFNIFKPPRFNDGVSTNIDRRDVKAFPETKLYTDVTGIKLPSIDSDRRLKNVGEVFKGGLDEIKKLEVFNYTYKKDKDKTPRVGVMAQDLQKIFPNAVFKGDDGFLRIRMEDIFYALVNAVKELDKRIDLLVEKQKKIDELEKRVDTLEKRLAKLEKQIKEK